MSGTEHEPDTLPAARDEAALEQARQAARLLNRLYSEQENQAGG